MNSFRMIFSTLTPDTGLISNFLFFASARNAGSFMVAANALRNAAIRSCGTPSGAVRLRPIKLGVARNSRIFLCSSFFAKSSSRETFGRSACLFSPIWPIGQILPALSEAHRHHGEGVGERGV